MNSKEMKGLIDEVATSGEKPLERAKLLAAMLQAYHLAIIGEELSALRIQLQPAS